MSLKKNFLTNFVGLQEVRQFDFKLEGNIYHWRGLKLLEWKILHKLRIGLIKVPVNNIFLLLLQYYERKNSH